MSDLDEVREIIAVGLLRQRMGFLAPQANDETVCAARQDADVFLAVLTGRGYVIVKRERIAELEAEIELRKRLHAATQMNMYQPSDAANNAQVDGN